MAAMPDPLAAARVAPPALIRMEAMELHADLRQRAVVDTHALTWRPSPMAGVERRLLDRQGGEVARATSIVRYAPGSRFEQHSHGGGEEILVLEGTFSDEKGDYQAGTYLRNPVGSQHAPFSAQGCTLLVKLHQMHPSDGQRQVVDTLHASWLPGRVRGLEVLPLHTYGSEHVALVRWAPGTCFQTHGHPGGEEILVLRGVFQDEAGRYPTGSWLRNPPGSVHRPWSEAGCTIWVKTGHLPSTQGPDDSAPSMTTPQQSPER
jgi:anti-sigma factor ChrR (cupin superfamily)